MLSCVISTEHINVEQKPNKYIQTVILSSFYYLSLAVFNYQLKMEKQKKKM